MADTTQLAGFVDSLNAELLSGWAWDALQPDNPIVVDIFVDGVLTQRVVADAFGADLHHAGIGNGFHRWSCPVQDLILIDEGPHEIAARYSGTSIDLWGSPRALPPRHP